MVQRPTYLAIAAPAAILMPAWSPLLQVVIVDEIGTELEALACRTIAERGVTLIGTAHGTYLENLSAWQTLVCAAIALLGNRN